MGVATTRSLLVSAPHPRRWKTRAGYLDCPWVAPWGQRALGSGTCRDQAGIGCESLGAGQCVRQLPPGTDAELGEHVAQMPLHGPRAEEEPRADLRIGQPVAGEPGDLPLLGGQIVARFDRPLAHLLARGLKLLTGALGERLHPDRGQHLVGRAQLLARVDPAILAAQPLAVEQMRAGDLRTEPGTPQPLDRLAVQLVGGRPVAQQRPAARFDAERELGAGRVASSPPAARAHRGRARRLLRARPPRRARAAPTWVSSG